MIKFDHSKYNPNPLLAPGECTFNIINCEETQSKTTGNNMLKLTLSVQDSKNCTALVYDYILEDERWLWKIKALCDAIGHAEIFEMDELHPSFLKGKSGTCLINHETDTKYGTKNRLKSYLSPADIKDTPKSDGTFSTDTGDDLPF